MTQRREFFHIAETLRAKLLTSNESFLFPVTLLSPMLPTCPIMQSVTSKVKPIPQGYHTVTPYLAVQGVSRLINFLEQAFNAQETEKMTGPDGRVGHAEVKIGDSIIMMGEPTKESKPMPGMVYLYLEDTDAAYKRALDAGATSLRAPTDMFYGDRSAAVTDAFGNQWWIATHIEDVTPDEMQRRMKTQQTQ